MLTGIRLLWHSMACLFRFRVPGSGGLGRGSVTLSLTSPHFGVGDTVLCVGATLIRGNYWVTVVGIGTGVLFTGTSD